MKRFTKIVSIVLILVFLVSCADKNEEMRIDKEPDKRMVFLVAGLDDAAENTDVLFSIGFDTDSANVNIAQIPRDTYFAFGTGQNKINQYYATKRAEGLDAYGAMEQTATALGSAFGTEFDGYIALGTDAFVRIVDILGGVDIELADDLILEFENEEPLYLHAGINHIDSSKAELFVRYRKGYTTQDLGRMDAQKIFLNALFWKISSSLNLPSVIALSNELQRSACTNIKLRELVPVLWKSFMSGKDITSNFVTMAGEPQISESGVSYYVINRLSSEKIAKKYMFSHYDFDRKHMFLNTGNVAFADIYEDNSINYVEYSSENIKNISLKNK